MYLFYKSSKRKSGSEEVEFVVRLKGRQAAKKKSKASLSKFNSTKSKAYVEEEISILASLRPDLEQSRATQY